MKSFIEKLIETSEKNQSLLCIGLDPDPDLMPVDSVFEFNRAIIEATSDIVCAYKPNIGFYEAMGPPGLDALMKTRECIPSNIPIIIDAKRGDTMPTAKFYAKSLFETLGFDAATVNPYLGRDSLAPFFDYADKGVFILCRTSNPGGKELQDLVIGEKKLRLYEWIAMQASLWNENNNIGLVVGATYPGEIKKVRSICPEMPLLIPGIGPQQGALALSVRNGVDSNGNKAIINSSRQVLYASKNKKDFDEAARTQALLLRAEINNVLARG
jgi:orotidine-5'-phosphate decarboxylase